LIPTGEQSLLLMRIAATESVSFVRADEKLTAHRRSEGVKPDTDFSQKFPTAGAPVLSNSRG
jgi:hypothetical protein